MQKNFLYKLNKKLHNFAEILNKTYKKEKNIFIQIKILPNNKDSIHLLLSLD